MSGALPICHFERSRGISHHSAGRDVSTSLDMTMGDDLFPKIAKVLTVAELTRAIRGTLETSYIKRTQGRVATANAYRKLG